MFIPQICYKIHFTLNSELKYSMCFSNSDLHQNDDFIFEDFARLRLQGHEMEDTEA